MSENRDVSLVTKRLNEQELETGIRNRFKEALD